MAKKFEELQLKDNFMFCAVMMDPANCKELLETILEMPIDRVTVEKEKTIVYNPEDISPKLLEFLNYVKDHRTAEGGITGYAVRLEESIRKIKQDREVRSRYMLYEEMMKKEHDAGFAEGFDKGRREEQANTERERKRAEKAEAKIAALKEQLLKYQKEDS